MTASEEIAEVVAAVERSSSSVQESEQLITAALTSLLEQNKIVDYAVSILPSEELIIFVKFEDGSPFTQFSFKKETT